MSTDDLIRQVRAGMPVVTSDGVVLGKLWRIHIRDAEAVLEVRPRTFWNAIEDIVLEVPRHANTSHLFVPAQAALEIRKKRVYLKVNGIQAKTYTSRPPWIERGDIPPTGFNSPRLD